MIFSKFHIVFIGLVFNVYGVMTVTMSQRGLIKAHRAKVDFEIQSYGDINFETYQAGNQALTYKLKKDHKYVLLIFIDPTTGHHLLTNLECRIYAELAMAHVCFIKPKEVEKYNRITSSTYEVTNKDKMTLEYRWQLVADTVADVMLKAGVDPKNIIVLCDGRAAVIASMFCVEMGKRKRGIIKKTKGLFGHDPKELCDTDEKVQKLYAISPEGLSGTDKHIIQKSHAHFVEVFYNKGEQPLATAHVMVKIIPSDRYDASTIFTATATKIVVVSRHGHIEIIHTDIGSSFVQPPDAGKEYFVLGLLGSGRGNHNDEYTIDPCIDQVNEKQPLDHHVLGKQHLDIPDLSPEDIVPVSFHCIFYQDADTQTEFRVYQAEGPVSTALVFKLLRGDHNVLLFFVRPDIVSMQYLFNIARDWSKTCELHVIFITSWAKEGVEEFHFYAVAHTVARTMSHGFRLDKLLVVGDGIAAVAAKIFCNLIKLKHAGRKQKFDKIMEKEKYLYFDKIQKFYAINPKEFSPSTAIQKSDAKFVEVFNNVGEKTDATAHVMVNVIPAEEYGAFEIFATTATPEFRIYVSPIKDQDGYHDMNLKLLEYSVRKSRGLLDQVSLGVLGTFYHDNTELTMDLTKTKSKAILEGIKNVWLKYNPPPYEHNPPSYTNPPNIHDLTSAVH